MSAPRRFLVVGMQRSGTSVTHACLRGHPQVTAHPEELHVSLFRSRSRQHLTAAGESPGARAAAYAELFDALALDDDRAPPAGRWTAMGLKTAIGSHEHAIAVANTLREFLPGVAVILTHRRDLVAQQGSLLRAQHSGRWHSYDAARGGSGRVTIDPADFLAYAEQAHRAVAQLRTLGETHPFLELSYEDDVVPGHWTRAFGFLGLEDVPVDWLRMSKVSPPPGTYIANYGELHALSAALPEPSVDEERAAAQRRLSAIECTDSALFQAHRAKLALQRGDAAAAHEAAMAGMRLAATEAAASDVLDWLLRMLEDAWFALGDVDLARRSVGEIASVCAGQPSFLVLRALVEHHAGDTEAARRDLDAVLAVDPQHDRAVSLRRQWFAG